MPRSGPTWHIAALVALVSMAGCYDMHAAGRTDAGASPDAPARRDGGAPTSDVGAPSIDAGDACAEAIARLRAGEAAESIGCDGRTFPAECRAVVGRCCTLYVSCEVAPTDGGHLVADLACTDLCAQDCGSQLLEDCALFPYCERFEPDACGPPPDGIIGGPACIAERSDPCEDDADCDAGLTCRSYWVHPCPGGRCAACGAEERRCSL